ncbi:hypothetical protein Y1Q_0007571 [Alligator mississippiensis]|uniref:G-protein coupled receptors family 1 profile domain-containing protein n=1 Tax=Alligator mississippiensis TaxID=8496 RepID=A0A151NTJ8_ALLMI|nr:hypothetical protein Y1Q_0007571 [Alligator mississippiensis]
MDGWKGMNDAILRSNDSCMVEFVLLGFSLPQSLEIPTFMVLLAVFLLTLTENILITVLVRTNHQLHTPMYFFLCNLSILEVLFIFPLTLKNLLSEDKVIYWGCLAQ